MSSWLIILALGLPLFAALCIWFFGQSPNQRETITLVSAGSFWLACPCGWNCWPPCPD